MELYPLPPSWEWSTLGDLSEKPQYGWTTRASSTGSIQFLRTTDISAGSIDWSTVPFCDDAPPHLEVYLLKSGDIVISRAGSIGLSALITNCPTSVFASYLIRFRPSRELDERYVAFYLQSPSYWNEVAKNASGIALQNINATKLSAIPVPVSPIPEQRRIVAEIETQFTRLDAAVAALERARANLKRYRDSLFHAAISGRLSANCGLALGHEILPDN